MSGPKGGGYSVRAQELQRQRALEQARQAAGIARSELLAAIRDAAEQQANRDGLDLEVPGPPPPAPPQTADIEEHRRYSNEVNQVRVDLQRQLVAAHRARRTAMATARLADAGQVRERVAADEVLGDAPVEQDPVADAARSGDRLLERLRDDVDPTALDGIHDSLDRLRAARSADDTRRWQIELRHRIDTANRSAIRREEDRERARQLLTDLRASHSGPSSDLDAALVDVIEGSAELAEGLVDAVRERVRAARDAADARYVTSSVGEVLTGLGYDVGGSFDTVLAREGRAHVRGAGQQWDDHGIRVRLDTEQRELIFHVVRADDSAEDAARDRGLEEDWCGDLPALLEGLGDRAVDLTITTRAEPGELPVLPVPREMLTTDASDADDRSAVDEADTRRRDRRRRQRRQPKERGR